MVQVSCRGDSLLKRTVFCLQKMNRKKMICDNSVVTNLKVMVDFYEK